MSHIVAIPLKSVRLFLDITVDYLVFGIIVWIIMIKTDEPVCYNCEVSTETPETPN